MAAGVNDDYLFISFFQNRPFVTQSYSSVTDIYPR